MKRALLALVFSGLILNSSGAMASVIGQCDALAAKFTGSEQQVVQGINVEGNCTDLAGRLTDFGNAGCPALLDSGQLYLSHLRLDHSLIQNACTALNCICGFEIPECVGVVDCS